MRRSKRTSEVAWWRRAKSCIFWMNARSLSGIESESMEILNFVWFILTLCRLSANFLYLSFIYLSNDTYAANEMEKQRENERVAPYICICNKVFTMSAGMLKLKSNRVAGGDNASQIERNAFVNNVKWMLVCMCACVWESYCVDNAKAISHQQLCKGEKFYLIHVKRTIKNTLFAFGRSQSHWNVTGWQRAYGIETHWSIEIIVFSCLYCLLHSHE